MRDTRLRGYSREAVTNTILRRMPDYVHYMTPQFSRTHINFQRVPVVDTSNPFIANDIPSQDESFVVIRFANPRGIDFPYLLTMIDGAFMSRANTIVIPGGKMPLAMQPRILTAPLSRRRPAPQRTRLTRWHTTHRRESPSPMKNSIDICRPRLLGNRTLRMCRLLVSTNSDINNRNLSHLMRVIAGSAGGRVYIIEHGFYVHRRRVQRAAVRGEGQGGAAWRGLRKHTSGLPSQSERAHARWSSMHPRWHETRGREGERPVGIFGNTGGRWPAPDRSARTATSEGGAFQPSSNSFGHPVRRIQRQVVAGSDE